MSRVNKIKELRAEFDALRPRPRVEIRRNWLVYIVMTIAILCSFGVSAMRTHEAFGGGVMGILAIGMVELVLVGIAIGLSLVTEVGERQLKYMGSFAAIYTILIVAGANLYVTLNHAGKAPGDLQTAVLLLTALDAPIIAFVGAEIVAAIEVRRIRRGADIIAEWDRAGEEYVRGKLEKLDEDTRRDKERVLQLKAQEQARVAPVEKRKRPRDGARQLTEAFRGMSIDDVKAQGPKQWNHLVGRTTFFDIKKQYLQNTDAPGETLQ